MHIESKFIDNLCHHPYYILIFFLYARRIESNFFSLNRNIFSFLVNELLFVKAARERVFVKVFAVAFIFNFYLCRLGIKLISNIENPDL